MDVDVDQHIWIFSINARPLTEFEALLVYDRVFNL
jgi:hypothetical protein